MDDIPTSIYVRSRCHSRRHRQPTASSTATARVVSQSHTLAVGPVLLYRIESSSVINREKNVRRVLLRWSYFRHSTNLRLPRPSRFAPLSCLVLFFFAVAQNFVIMRHCGKVGGHELAAQLREPTTLTAITREVKAPEFDPHFYREVPTPERGTCRGCKVCHQPRACACVRASAHRVVAPPRTC